MIDIKFSHLYTKMPPQVKDRQTYLLDVWVYNKARMSKAFIDWDTHYRTANQLESGAEFFDEHFAVPEGQLLVLFLATSPMAPHPVALWTTLRSYNLGKEAYYRKYIGQQVRIVFTEGA
jgi:hypothetical protein